MKAIKNSSQSSLIRLANYRVRCAVPAGGLAAWVGLVSILSLHATVLDNFSGTKTGWTDTLNGGTVNQAGSQFAITTAVAAGTVTSSQKTSTSLALSTGNALEVLANVLSANPGSGDPSPLTIVGWVPTGGQLLANGYSLLFGSQDFIIQKNGTPVFSTNFSAAGANCSGEAPINWAPQGCSSSVTRKNRRALLPFVTFRMNWSSITSQTVYAAPNRRAITRIGQSLYPLSGA